MDLRADAAAAAIAARQLGLVTLAQARETGLSERQVRHRLATGRWRRVQRGVFAISGVPQTWHASVLAAVLAAGPGAVASHVTAAALHGLGRLGRPEGNDVLVPAGRCPRVEGARIHRTRLLPPRDVTRVGRVPTTTGERTLIDLAGIRDRVTVTALTDDAICARVVSRRGLHRRSLQLSSGRAGPDLLVALTRPGAEGEFHSWLEREFGAVVRDGGLPAPLWNARVRDRRGLVGIVDAVWPEARVAVELDGLRFHSSPAQRRRDDARFRRLLLAGWKPLRYTWLDVVQNPRAVVQELAEALAAQLAHGDPA